MGPVITIDGPSGAGKSTVSRRLATLLGYTYIDSGALYRIAALELLQQGANEESDKDLRRICSELHVRFVTENGTNRIVCNGKDVTELIRTPEISMLASRISARMATRDCLTALQRQLCAGGNIVLEGRDAGTVVFPDAPFKFFLDASPEERGRRRFEELREKGLAVSLEEVTHDIITRDHNDSSRKHAPLAPAKDATIINSTAMTLDQVIARMMEIIRSKNT
jgi:cytidylate kinase